MSKIKVRFAPSPTGPLHIGGARSALFNYLFAAQQDGVLLLRIEDTDLERSKREYEDEIIESLESLGITWAEGFHAGGEDGPYRQTERLSTYEQYADELMNKGQAYYCFCSSEDLEAERQELINKGDNPRYMGKCRELSDSEAKAKIESGIKPSIRFKVPQQTVFVVDDLVRGSVSFESEEIGDFIIVKSDGIPTYNFAVVIDDVLMKITHVIRAEEHLSNTPRQLMVYDALNFKRPKFAHISLILGSDRQKMSKRHGATSLIQYREMGYLPEAMFNFLALLGWSPEGEEVIMSPEQIIKAFTLDRVAKNPAVFDVDKLNWINQQHIKLKSIEELKILLEPVIAKSEFIDSYRELSEEKYTLLIEGLRDYLVCLNDFNEQASAFFIPLHIEEEIKGVLQAEGVGEILSSFVEALPDIQDIGEIKNFMKSFMKENKLKPKNLFMPLRCALTGRNKGPEIPYFISIWGKDKVKQRIAESLQKTL